MPQIFFGKVMHGRLFPKKNNFIYRIYYLALPLSELRSLPISYNSFGALSFYDRDHGARDGSDLQGWARDVLDKHGFGRVDGDITLICMPRIFGYVFNPVSFWLCHDRNGVLRAVLSEVNNTFGERHTYICAHDDQREIVKGDVLTAQKLFHVSPFLEREGHYSFRFDVCDNRFGAWIDFFDAQGRKQLITSLAGHFEPMDRQSLSKALRRYPLISFKAITLIHWQAVKLVLKGISYISKPIQKTVRISVTNGR